MNDENDVIVANQEDPTTIFDTNSLHSAETATTTTAANPPETYNSHHIEGITPEHGSTVAEATFNFTNSIIGAGAIGLGGAMAASGGLISIFLILFFGYLTKLSLDRVIKLSVETEGTANGSYENLAQAGLGTTGRIVVMVCKMMYSFGCLVAYIVVLKDNLAPAIQDLLFHHSIYEHKNVVMDWLHALLSNPADFTWFVSLSFVLPLCLLRDMTPLSSLSVVSVASMVCIVVIIVYMYWYCPEIRVSGGSTYTKWIEVRPGVLESLGTFLFTFVSQHTVHLVFSSLKPSIRTVNKWKVVSTLSLGSATTVSLSVGLFVYMTFWESTQSDIFDIYPQGWMVDLAKILLCITMILTFPLPFFTCRELIVVSCIHPFCQIPTDSLSHSSLGRSSLWTSTENPSLSTLERNDLQEPLLNNNSSDNDICHENEMENDTREESDTTEYVSFNNGVDSESPSLVSSNSRRLLLEQSVPNRWLLPEDDRQLRFVGHISLTVMLWILVTYLAIAAPSLGDVLDLVGCASGTVIAFILPALLSFRIEGYSHVAMIIFVVGGLVGTVGTYFSLQKLFLDLKE